MTRRLIAATAMLLTASLHAEEASSQVTIGSPAPDFLVTGIDGGEFKLSDKIKSGKNVALLFSRAHW